MINFAFAEIKGRSGSIPELRYTQGGSAVLNVALAVNKTYNKDKAEKTEITEWFNVTLFGKVAEIYAPMVQKGSMCWARGELQTRKWTDKSGNVREQYSVRAISFEVCQPLNNNQATFNDIASKNNAQMVDEPLPF